MKKIFILMSVSSCLLLIVSCTTQFPSAIEPSGTTEQIESLNQELVSKDSQIVDLQEQIKDKDARIVELEEQVQELQSEVERGVSETPTSVTYELHGTYTATVRNYDLGTSMKRTITFKGDTMTIYDELIGKTICTYFIPGGLESGQVIDFTNVVTGEKYTSRFKYSAEYDSFTIGEGILAVTYYR